MSVIDHTARRRRPRVRWMLTICVSFTIGFVSAATLFAWSSRIPVPLKASQTRGADDLLSRAGTTTTTQESTGFQERLENRQLDVTDTPRPQVEPRKASLPAPIPRDDAQESAAAPVPVVATTPRDLSYFVQAGSFSDAGAAQELVDELGGLGMVASVRRITDAGGSNLHRVLVGPFEKSTEAESARANLAISGRESTLMRLAPE